MTHEFSSLGDRKRPSRFNPDLAELVKADIEREEKEKALKDKLAGKRSKTRGAEPTPEPIIVTPTIPYVKGSFRDHKEFYGKNTDKMSELVAEGRTPMNTKELLTKRVEVLTSTSVSQEEKDYWMNNYFDTGDGALYLPNGDLWIVHDAQALREMTKDSPLIDKALDMSGFDLSKISNVVKLTKADLKKIITGKDLTLKQAKNHPIWLALLRNDKELLEAYAPAFFTHAKATYDYDKNMGVYLGSASEKPKMRAWYVFRTDFRSRAYGYGNVDGTGGRLVGLASETQSAAKK